MLTEEILVVNDGSLLLPVMSCLLEAKGYRLSLTDSSEEAFVRLNTRNIKMVIVKMNGKQMDRLMLMHMVKNLSDDNKLIILAEAATPPAAIFEIEADDYILLPRRMAGIWRRISLHLEPSPRQPGFHRDKSLALQVTRQIFQTLDLLLQEMLDEATSLSRDLKLLKLKSDSRAEGEEGATFQKTSNMTQTLIGMTEAFFHKFLYEKLAASSPAVIDLEPDAVLPAIEETGRESYTLSPPG